MFCCLMHIVCNCIGGYNQLQKMSGRAGFQPWSTNSYKHTSESSYRRAENADDVWWDEEPSSVAHVTQVFHSQTLNSTVGNDWDAWDGDYTSKTARAAENSNTAGNYGWRDDVWQPGTSGQYPDRFGQQCMAVESIADDAPTDMRIPHRLIGLVVGKGGSRIRELQDSSGAKIFVRKNDVDARDMVLVTLEGDAASRISAKRMIDELMEKDCNSANTGHMDGWQNERTSTHFNNSTGFGDTTVLTVALHMLGAVIGRGGRQVREIQDRTQTNIKIDKRCGEITISGTKEGREQAKLLIDDVIQSESETGSKPGPERPNNSGRQQNFEPSSAELQVPTNMLGAIIGRGGQNIKDISDKTQTKIKISDDRHGVTVDITITGSDEGQREAKSLIESAFQSTSETRYTSNSQGSGFNTINHQHRSGFGGDFDNTCNVSSDRSHFMPNSEGSRFAGSHAGSSQRSGFGNFDQSEPAERSFGNTERSSFGTSVSLHGFGGMIDWDQVKEMSRKHEEVKWQDYPPIKKNFYIEDAGVANMDPEEVSEIREQNNNIMVSCEEDSEVHIPNPVRSFDEGFLHYPEILSELKRAGFTKPSPIQMQGWPIALQGLDLIGIAQTGTGKTLAFLLPAFIHIEGQPVPRGKRGGPNVLVLSPTRELALQVRKLMLY